MIDDYIRKLKNQSMDLKRKRDELYDLSFKIKRETGKDPYFDKITNVRIELEIVKSKINFLIELRKELMNYEMQNKKSR